MAAEITGLLSATDLSYEPDDGLRRELHDGVIHVVPPPSDHHSWEVRIVDRALSVAAPDDIYILQNVGVHVGIRRLYIPDLIVVRRDNPFHDNGYDPSGVLLAVEVVSPSSLTLDRITKPIVYAEQGIPYFWRIDDGPTLQTFRLDPTSGKYEPDVELGPDTRAELGTPWPVTVDTAELVIPHRR